MICEWFSFAQECDLPNWLTMIIELAIAGVFAIILSIVFYNRQKKQSTRLFELENSPMLDIKTISEKKIGQFIITFENKGRSVARINQIKVKVAEQLSIYDKIEEINYPKFGEFSIDANSQRNLNIQLKIPQEVRGKDQFNGSIYVKYSNYYDDKKYSFNHYFEIR